MMTICEIIDSYNKKVIRIDYWNDNKVKVVQSHGLSYISAREQYQECGYTMGLDKK